jgi:hypothetical protein
MHVQQLSWIGTAAWTTVMLQMPEIRQKGQSGNFLLFSVNLQVAQVTI